MKNRFFALGLTLCLLMSPVAQGQGEAKRYTMYFFGAFDTMVSIIGYADSVEVFERVTGQAQARFEELHKLFDAYHEYEGLQNIYTLNRDAHKSPVTVAPELLAMLQLAREWQPRMRETINIGMGTVLKLWHKYRQQGMDDENKAALPPMEDLQAAAAHTNYDSVILDEEESTVYFSDPELQLDVGAIAKGYAAGLVAEMMVSGEMPHFIINAGGNVCTGEPPMDGRGKWGVSLQNPDSVLSPDAEEQSLDVLYVSNMAVVTSGDYQRFYTVDGVRYHHIISPETLMPATENRAVTVVCKDSALADLLSTALFILPYQEGRALAESLDGVEVLWMLADGTLVETEGMVQMSKNHGATNGIEIP